MIEEIKVGDTVLVTRGPSEGEEFKWDNVWVSCMDYFIGREAKVINVDESQGYDLDDDSGADCCGYGYPREVLQLINRGNE